MGLVVIPHQTRGMLIDGSMFVSSGFVRTSVGLPDGREILVIFALLDNLPVDVIIGRLDMIRYNLFGLLVDQPVEGEAMACWSMPESVDAETAEPSEEGESVYTEHLGDKELNLERIPPRYIDMVTEHS